jgi:DNA-binding transcriptional MerR regulator
MSNQAEPGARGQFGIGEVLAQLRPEFPDISTSKIRFLEAEGLIEPERTRSGYRKFGVADVQRLRHILTLQRDSYLPLRVIKERLANGEASAGSAGAGGAAAGDGDGLTRRQLLDEAGISDAELTELEDYGLIRRVGRTYGGEALAVARAVMALRQYGVQARHLRAVKAAADREATLVEQVVAPRLRQRGPGARDAALRTAWQIADLTLRLHATLMESALTDAGLASASLRLGSYEPMPLIAESGEPQGLRTASGR